MAVARTSTGAFNNGLAGFTAVFGAGAAAGNFGLLLTQTDNQAAIAVSNWTGESTLFASEGSAAAAGATRCTAQYRNGITGAEITSGIAVGDSGDHQLAALLTYSGVDGNNPTLNSGTASVTVATTSVDGTVGGAFLTADKVKAGDVVLAIIACDRDSATASTNTAAAWSNVTGSNSFVLNGSTTTGNGGQLIVNELLVTADATGGVNFTCSITSARWAMFLLVLKAPRPNFTRQQQTIPFIAAESDAVEADVAAWVATRSLYRKSQLTGPLTHATTGALTGAGSTLAGSAAHIAIHTSTGALTGPGSTIVGAAVYNAVHPTSGVLTGPGSAIAGTAARTREHATTGALTGPGTTLAGVAVYNAKHTTSGALTGQGSTIVGSAARTRQHATTGALTGAGSTIVGAAVYNAKHTTTGALTGPGTALAGSAARFRAFATSGVLVGPGSTIAGAADHVASVVAVHATSGALIGQPSIIDGTAARTRLHVTSGALVGPSAFIFGYDTRSRGHDSSGALLGVTGAIFGRAFNGTPQLQDIPVDSDDLVNEPSPPAENFGSITEPSGQIVNHPPYPAA